MLTITRMATLSCRIPANAKAILARARVPTSKKDCGRSSSWHETSIEHPSDLVLEIGPDGLIKEDPHSANSPWQWVNLSDFPPA